MEDVLSGQNASEHERESDIASLMDSLDICRSEAEHLWNEVCLCDEPMSLCP